MDSSIIDEPWNGVGNKSRESDLLKLRERPGRIRNSPASTINCHTASRNDGVEFKPLKGWAAGGPLKAS